MTVRERERAEKVEGGGGRLRISRATSLGVIGRRYKRDDGTLVAERGG